MRKQTQGLRMTDDELFDLDDIDDSDEDPFADVDSPKRPASRTLEEFEAEVDQKIKTLMSRKNDPKERVEAAYWLGESGAPKAITALTTVYEKDKKNKKVQQASAYALGQFKALDEAIIRDEGESVMDALGRDENEGIVQLLQDIALHDERGKRLRLKTGTLVGIMAALAVLFGVLVVLNLVLPASRNRENSRIAMRGSGTLAQRSVDEVSLRLDELEEDAELLQTELNNVRGGEALNCSAGFNNPQDFPLDAGVGMQFPDAQLLINDYNAVQADYVRAKLPYDEACRTSASISETATNGALTTLTSVLNTIPDLKSQAADLQTEINASVTATAQAQGTNEALQLTASVPTDIPTEAPTATATPGLEQSAINRHAGEMINMIDQATGTRGFNTILAQYWAEARDNGATNGCSLPTPTIPEDYVLTEEEQALAPELANAAVQLNTGLALARTGWTFFTNACNNGTVGQNFQLGLDTTAGVQGTLDAALRILNEVNRRGA
jgi:hypothetical protein